MERRIRTGPGRSGRDVMVRRKEKRGPEGEGRRREKRPHLDEKTLVPGGHDLGRDGAELAPIVLDRHSVRVGTSLKRRSPLPLPKSLSHSTPKHG